MSFIWACCAVLLLLGALAMEILRRGPGAAARLRGGGSPLPTAKIATEKTRSPVMFAPRRPIARVAPERAKRLRLGRGGPGSDEDEDSCTPRARNRSGSTL